jgi:hypothetical protein
MLSNQHEHKHRRKHKHEQLCFVCYRVVDMPTPRVPSVQWPCASCDAPIWVPKKSPVALPKICIRCTGPDISTQPESDRRNLGHHRIDPKTLRSRVQERERRESSDTRRKRSDG